MNLELEPEILQKFRHGDIRHCYGDTLRAKKELSFEPAISFDKAIEDYVEWLGGQSATDRVDQAQLELRNRGLVT